MFRFADPKNDLAFKKIFGNEKHKNILISFLNAVLDFSEGEQIENVELESPYQPPDIPELKESILDIHATAQDGSQFIVEVQTSFFRYFDKRSLYYTSKAYTSQLNQAEQYSQLKKIYFVGVLNFNLFKTDASRYLSRHQILDTHTYKNELKDFEFVFIELNKFQKKLEELETVVEKWIYFLKEAPCLEIVPEELESEEPIKDAFEIANQQTWNVQELRVYERKLDYMRVMSGSLLDATLEGERKGMQKGIEKGIEKGRQEGMEKGKQEGRKEGMEKGMQKGIEKGKQEGEHQKALDIAKKLLASGMDLQSVCSITGLSQKTLES